MLIVRNFFKYFYILEGFYISEDYKMLSVVVFFFHGDIGDENVFDFKTSDHEAYYINPCMKLLLTPLIYRL